jgi:chromosome segregation ATPase
MNGLRKFIERSESKGFDMRNLRKELEQLEAKLAELEEQAELLERLALYITRSKTHANTLYWAKHLELEKLLWELGDDFDYLHWQKNFNTWKRLME